MVPDEDVPALKSLGVADVLLQETPPETIAARIREVVRRPGRWTDRVAAGSIPTWPPRYDPGYRPPDDAEYWLPEVECADRRRATR